MLTLLLYLGVGIAADALVAAYTISVGRGWALVSSGLSLGITLLNFFVLSQILIAAPSWPNALAYGVGNALGCWGIMVVSRSVNRRHP